MTKGVEPLSESEEHEEEAGMLSIMGLATIKDRAAWHTENKARNQISQVDPGNFHWLKAEGPGRPSHS